MTRASYRRAMAVSCPGELDDPASRARLEAKGDHYLADEIVRMARECGVPVVDDATLATALDAFEVEDEIPHEFAGALAVVLGEIDTLVSKKKRF